MDSPTDLAGARGSCPFYRLINKHPPQCLELTVIILNPVTQEWQEIEGPLLGLAGTESGMTEQPLHQPESLQNPHMTCGTTEMMGTIFKDPMHLRQCWNGKRQDTLGN